MKSKIVFGHVTAALAVAGVMAGMAALAWMGRPLLHRCLRGECVVAFGVNYADRDRSREIVDAEVAEVLRRRLSAMGAVGAEVEQLGNGQFLVKSPSADGAMRRLIRESLPKAGVLQFRLVHADNDELVQKLMWGMPNAAPEGYRKVGDRFVRADDYAAVSRKPGHAERVAAFHAPPHYQLMFKRETDGTYTPFFVSRHTELTGDSVIRASVVKAFWCIAVDFEFDAEGGETMRQLTRNYIAYGAYNHGTEGRQLAIILDGEVLSAPILKSVISTRGQITGNFDEKGAQELATFLNAGSLPAPLEIIDEESATPIVGDGSISARKVDALLGVVFTALAGIVSLAVAAIALSERG